MSRYTVEVQHIPVLGSERILILDTMSRKINLLPIEWTRVKLADYYFYCPSFDGWRKVIDYLMPKLPKYYLDKFDCENFAGWFRHKAAEVFRINTFAEVEGYADLGEGMERHGWGVFTDGKYFYQMETQTGVIMDIDDLLYVPDEIVMG